MPLRGKAKKHSVSAKKIDTNVSANTQNNDSLTDNTQISQISINLNKAAPALTKKVDFSNDPWIDDDLKNVLYKMSPAYLAETEEAFKLRVENLRKQLELDRNEMAQKTNDWIEKTNQNEKAMKTLGATVENKESELNARNLLNTKKSQQKPFLRTYKPIIIPKTKAEIAELAVKAEKERINNFKIAFPGITKKNIPSYAQVNPLYLEIGLKRLEEENKAKAASKLAEKERLDAINNIEELKAKRIEELKELLDNSKVNDVYLPDSKRYELERELKRLTKQVSNNNSNKRSYSTSALRGNVISFATKQNYQTS